MRSLCLLPLLVLPFAIAHCSSSNDSPPPVVVTPTDAGPTEVEPPLVPASKVDLLFVVDNSASMADKQALLASSAGALIQQLSQSGDLHVGFISTSLGSPGGDVCPDTGRSNDKAHLLGTNPAGFLSYKFGDDLPKVMRDAEATVIGIGQTGCGLEAQLESAYRFLNEPDPWEKVTSDPVQKTLVFTGTDDTLLKQRKAFLRPDSAVGIVLLTDEDDASVDPLSLGKKGSYFVQNQFPGSTTFRADGRSTTAIHRSSACDTDLLGAGCNSCVAAYDCDETDAACAALKADPACKTFFGPNDDDLNVRFFHMKERFGASPQFPVSRYIDGLSKRTVPLAQGGHDAKGNWIGGDDCTNPLFAAALPDGANAELCHLPVGTRNKGLVFFALIGGVPDRLTNHGAPTDANWLSILGQNPDTFERAGIDPHMIQSITARDGLPPATATRGDNGTDPDNGREWDTGGVDLQYACTFALPTAQQRPCTANDYACECAPGAGPTHNPPLCSADNVQIRAKAYPTIRELQVAKALGARAVTTSICALDGDGLYSAAMIALGDKMTSVLAH